MTEDSVEKIKKQIIEFINNLNEESITDINMTITPINNGVGAWNYQKFSMVDIYQPVAIQANISITYVPHQKITELPKHSCYKEYLESCTECQQYAYPLRKFKPRKHKNWDEDHDDDCLDCDQYSYDHWEDNDEDESYD